MLQLLRALFGRKTSRVRLGKCRRAARTVHLGLESLEAREVPAHLLVIDFNGATPPEYTTALTQIPGWRDPATEGPNGLVGFTSTFSQLQSQFGGYDKYKFLDVNMDGKLDEKDANTLARTITDEVQERYSAFDLQVVREDVGSLALQKMNNFMPGDAMIYVGGYPGYPAGQAPLDIGNTRDDVGWAGGSVGAARWVTDMGFTGLAARKAFVNINANMIAHEAGHSFGLEHLDPSVAGVQGVSLMTPLLGGEDLVFQDKTLKSDSGFENEYRTLLGTLGSRQSDAAMANTSALAVSVNGQRFEFQVNVDGSVSYRQQDFTGLPPLPFSPPLSSRLQWTGWQNLGGNVSSVGVALGSDGLPNVFGIGTDHAVWVRQMTGAAAFSTPSWGGWTRLGGWVSSLTVTNAPNGSVSLYGIGGNSRVYANSQISGTSFTPWVMVGDQVVTSLTAARNEQGTTQLFVTGPDGAVYTNQQTGLTPTGGFKGWNPLGGIVRNLQVAVNQNGGFAVFGIGTNNAVWSITQQTAGAAFGNWSSLGGGVSQIAVGKNADGRLQVFAIGLDNAVWTTTQTAPNDTRYSGWGSLGGFVKSIAVDNRSSGRIEVYAVGGDNQIWTMSQERADRNAWFGWQHPANALALGAGFQLLRSPSATSN